MGLFKTITNVAGLAWELHNDFESYSESVNLRKKLAQRDKLEEAAKLGDADAMWDLACLYQQEGDEVVKEGDECEDADERQNYIQNLESIAEERFRWSLRAAEAGHPKAILLFKVLDPEKYFIAYDNPATVGFTRLGHLDVKRLKQIVFEIWRGKIPVNNAEEIAFDTKLNSCHINLDAYALHVPFSINFETFRDLCIFVAKKLSCSFSTHTYAKPSETPFEQSAEITKGHAIQRMATLPFSNAICPVCGHSVSADAKFCSECGAPLEKKCASCGTKLDPTMKFCPECGAKVANCNLSTVGRIQQEVRPEVSEAQIESPSPTNSEESPILQPPAHNEHDDIKEDASVDNDIESTAQNETATDDTAIDVPVPQFVETEAEITTESEHRDDNSSLEETDKAENRKQDELSSGDTATLKKIRVGNKIYAVKKTNTPHGNMAPSPTSNDVPAANDIRNVSSKSENDLEPNNEMKNIVIAILSVVGLILFLLFVKHLGQ